MQPYFYRLIFLLLCVISTALSADEVSKKDTIESRYIYTMGYRVGQSLTAQKIHSLDMQHFAQGVRDIWQEKTTGSVAKADSSQHEHYRMGYLIGQSLISQGVKHLDIETLVEGINAALPGNKPRMDELEMMDVLANYQAYQQALRDNNAQTRRQMKMSEPQGTAN